MDSTWLVVLALVVGVILGGGSAFALSKAARRGEEVAQVVNPSVPDGVDQVVENLESAALVLDPSNNVVKASPGAVALGMVADGRLTHPALASMVDRVRRDGAAFSEDHEIARGPYGQAQVSLHVRVSRLGSRYILLLARDQTESVRLDEVRRDFIANISHELKTPIGAVSVLADALSAAADEPEQVRRFATRLAIEGHRLSRITQDVIELSRLQAVNVVESSENISLDELITAALDANRVVADAHHVTLVRGGDKGAFVTGDAALLGAALHNVIANAIQYSPDGSRVGIGVKRVNQAVEIAITDQGIGIPESDLDRVFERFYRVDQARSRNTGGTGLGLAIAKHVVSNHGGDITVWSQAGRGSTFTIRLPESSDSVSTTNS